MYLIKSLKRIDKVSKIITKISKDVNKATIYCDRNSGTCYCYTSRYAFIAVIKVKTEKGISPNNVIITHCSNSAFPESGLIFEVDTGSSSD